MSIVKITSITLLLAMHPGLAESNNDCKSVLKNNDRSLRYFSCLQESLVEAEIKAKIYEAENRVLNFGGQDITNMQSLPTMPMPMPLASAIDDDLANMAALSDMPINDISEGTSLPRYVAYSASSKSKEAVIAYGKSEIRVNTGSILSGGWSVQDFNEYSLTVIRNKEKQMIPLTIVSGEDIAW